MDRALGLDHALALAGQAQRIPVTPRPPTDGTAHKHRDTKRHQNALGIVSKGVCEPVDRLTLFRGTFSPHILSKAKHYKCIELLRSNKWAPKSVNLLSRSVRQSRKFDSQTSWTPSRKRRWRRCIRPFARRTARSFRMHTPRCLRAATPATSPLANHSYDFRSPNNRRCPLFGSTLEPCSMELVTGMHEHNQGQLGSTGGKL